MTQELEFEIQGMTCASCAMRIEKKLNRLDGVTAAVNYATEKAHVTAIGDVNAEAIILEVEKTGYSANLPAPAAGTDDEASESPQDRELVSLKQRLIGSIVLSVPVIVLAMVPAWQFT